MIDYEAVSTLLQYSTCKFLDLFIYISSSSPTSTSVLWFHQIEIDHIYINLFVRLFHVGVEDVPDPDDAVAAGNRYLNLM